MVFYSYYTLFSENCKSYPTNQTKNPEQRGSMGSIVQEKMPDKKYHSGRNIRMENRRLQAILRYPADAGNNQAEGL